MKLRFRYWTKSQGIGGRIKTPEDFVVREVLHPKFLRKFQEQKYFLLYIKKRGITTHEAARRLGRCFGEVGFAGMKDKFSVSCQYFTARKYGRCSLTNPEILEVSRTGNWLSAGDLLGNEFEITLHGCRIKNLAVFEELRKTGVPNYFWLQRFGVRKNNHIIGRMLVKRNYGKALGLLNKNYRKKFAGIKSVPKQELKFFINAYQSWVFNGLLNKYISRNRKPYFRGAKLFGSDTKLGSSIPDRILKKITAREKITRKDFSFPDLKISCRGSERKLFVKTKIAHEISGSTAKLKFFLPKGSYATALLNEVCKDMF